MSEQGMNTAHVRDLAQRLSTQASTLDDLARQLSTTSNAARRPQSFGITAGDQSVAPWSVPSVSAAASELTAARGAIDELVRRLGLEAQSQDAASRGGSSVHGLSKAVGKTHDKNGPDTTEDGQYTTGPPVQPTYQWDEDFEYDSQEANSDDFFSAAAWKAKLAGAQVVRPDLKDGTEAYARYWENTGEHWEFDYLSAYENDSSVKTNVDNEISRAQLAAEELIALGNTSFSFTGKPSASEAYPFTENWQKAIGAYQQWSSADVTVNGDQITMIITVTADDYYNFNRGQADIASGSSDDENGRFTEIGWAKPFSSSGSITQTVTWTAGDPGSMTIVEDIDER